MDYTQNLHLPQWEETDRIMRTDFNDAMSKLDAAIANAGNCKIVTGSYVGAGSFLAEHANTLTFPGTPYVVMINGRTMLMVRPLSTAHNTSTQGGVVVTWGDNSVSWYSTALPTHQCNEGGVTYQYIALLA